MNAPMYPEADHSVVTAPSPSSAPAPPLFLTIPSMVGRTALTVSAGATFPRIWSRASVVCGYCPTSPRIAIRTMSAGKSASTA